MKLSYNLDGWVYYSLEKALGKIAKYGYEGVDLLCVPPFTYPLYLTASQIKELKELISSLQIEVANASAIHATPLKNTWWPDADWAEPSLSSLDPIRRKARVIFVKQVIDLAVELNADQVSVVSGYFHGDPDRIWSLFLESLEKCVDYTEARGIKIAIEPEPGMLVEFTDEALKATEEIGSKWLGVLFDVTHSINKGEDPNHMVKKLKAKNKLFHIHIADVKNKKHFHLIPGTGNADLRGLVNTLKQIDYSGYLTVQLYTYPHIAEQASKKSIDYLKSIL